MTFVAAQPGILGVLLRAAARPGLLGAANAAFPGTGSVGQVRFRRKIFPKRPHQPNWFRKRLLGLSKPVWDEDVPIEEEPLNCRYVARAEERETWVEHVNQLEKFYVEEMMDLFKTSQMVAFYHMNPIARCNFRKAWQNGRRIGMELRSFNKRIGRAGLKNTEWENCLHFFPECFDKDHDLPILFSPEVKPKQLISFEKKVPEYFLIGAVIYGRILSRKQVVDLVDVPDLDNQRQQLVALLNANQTKLSSLLQSNQLQLSRNLEQYLKDQGS